MFVSRSAATIVGLAGLFACAPATSACPRRAAESVAPAPIQVPAGLRARNESIEPSGVVWAAALDRYLVVSDDSGVGESRHAAWLLAMNRSGVFDEAPVPISDLAALNDGEAICAGPGDTFFLATSHSPNRKGHTPIERRQLFQLRLDGRALRVMGRLDLTTAQGANGGSLLEIAGLPADGRLDIEAITLHEGALLIGLKSPLSTRGGAVILRLDAPVQAIQSGSIPRGAITRFAEVTLKVTAHGTPVAQGIADLASLEDGSLLLLGNSPKGGPADGGGALYRLARGAGTAELIERFPGLKPEGITLAADGKTLLLVFDNDLRTPLWTRRPLPAAKR